jgi:hypothetical protein
MNRPFNAAAITRATRNGLPDSLSTPQARRYAAVTPRASKGHGARRRLRSPLSPHDLLHGQPPVAPWIFDQKRLSWHPTGPATPPSWHLRKKRPGATPAAPLRPSVCPRSPYLQYRTPYAQRMCFVPPCFRLPRRARPPPAFPPQNPFLVLRPSIRNAVFNGQFTATARSREPSIQHGYPSHALPRNDAPPCHVSCLRPGNAPRLRSPLLTSLTGSATLPFMTAYGWPATGLRPCPSILRRRRTLRPDCDGEYADTDRPTLNRCRTYGAT